MKPENAAVIFTDADTGKPYAAVLNESETLVIMAMLSGLQDGAIRAREVIPFELRSIPPKGIAGLLAQALTARNGVESLIGMKVSVKVDRRSAPLTTPPATTRKPCWNCKHLSTPEEVQENDGNCPRCNHEILSWLRDEDDKALCYQCGEETRQRLVGNEWHCKACHALQCERVRCELCGKTCTRPEGAHYCHPAKKCATCNGKGTIDKDKCNIPCPACNEGD